MRSFFIFSITAVILAVIGLSACAENSPRAKWVNEQTKLCTARSGKIYYNQDAGTVTCFNSIGNHLFSAEYTAR